MPMGITVRSLRNSSVAFFEGYGEVIVQNTPSNFITMR